MKRFIENKKARLFLKIFLLVVLIVFIVDQNDHLKKRKAVSEAKVLMDTIVKFDVCQEGHSNLQTENAFNEAWKNFKDIENKFNVYAENSEVSRINGSYPKTVSVSEETYSLIKDSVGYYGKTKGAFNICIGPLVKMWKNAKRNNVIPTEKEYLEIKDAIDISSIHLMEDFKVALGNKFARIDLGGVAKGYAIDEAVKIFKKHGFTSFLIDAGGDVYASGLNCENKPWRIGIRDPFDRSNVVDVVALTDAAVTTSGSYERYYQFEDNKYSHIFDPKNLFPPRDVLSATVIAPSAQEADVLSTSLCVLGEYEGFKLIDSYDDKYAAFMLLNLNKETFEKKMSKHYKNFR